MLSSFSEIWCVDFEFQSLPGEPPRPICMVALEVNSGKRIELFGDVLLAAEECPYSLSPDSLVVAYLASAELGCHLALGWGSPANVLDLYAEFRCWTNGLKLKEGAGLLGALSHFGLNTIVAAHKEEMRNLALRGGPWTERERRDLLAYCGEDVEALASLMAKMMPSLDLPRALVRGRYMKAVAHMEHAGIPVDTEVVNQLKSNWSEIRKQLIREVDAEHGVYDGTRFSQEKFGAWLKREGIEWPRLETRARCYKLDKKTFKIMSHRYPKVAQLRNLRQTLSQLKKFDLPVGEDGNARTLLSPFRSKTGRNQPSTTKFIFGLSKWSRSLIIPSPGNALAYIDWEQQEFGIAAALSGDVAMREAYRTGDPYLAFAKQAGAVPQDATKKSHEAIREQYKQCALAVQYLMGAKSLAERLGISVADAGALLAMHRRMYWKFWRWSDAVLDYARVHGMLHSVFGWRLSVNHETSERTIRNFAMQANGAEMLRVACCMLTEAGIQVCAPIHDAVLIQAPREEISQAVEKAKGLMSEASAITLDGFRLGSDHKIITAESAWEDKESKSVWEALAKRLGVRQFSDREVECHG